MQPPWTHCRKIKKSRIGSVIFSRPSYISIVIFSRPKTPMILSLFSILLFNPPYVYICLLVKPTICHATTKLEYVFEIMCCSIYHTACGYSGAYYVHRILLELARRTFTIWRWLLCQSVRKHAPRKERGTNRQAITYITGCQKVGVGQTIQSTTQQYLSDYTITSMSCSDPIQQPKKSP